MLLQSQQHSLQQQQQQAGGWSYPRGRDRRVRASGEGSLGYGSLSRSPNSALLQSSPVMQPRARSTSPSLGMHYLEKAPGNSSSSKGKAGSTRSSVCSGSIAALRGMGGSLACGVGGSSISRGVVAAAGLAEDPRFSAACKAFLDAHSTAVAAEGLSPTKASIDDGLGGARLAARLSPLKDADSSQIDEAMGRLASALQAHGVNLELSRSGPSLYSAAGRKLRLRMLNGNLLVRTGGGHQDLLDALGKLPLSAAHGGRIASAGSGSSSASSSRPSSGSSRASGSGRGEAAGEAGLFEAVEAEPDAEVNAEEGDEDEFCCYTTLTLEAAAAAGCADSDQQQQQQQQQEEAQQEEQQEEQGDEAAAGDAADDAEQQAVINAEDADHNDDGVVAVVKIGGEGSAVALQCLAELGSTGGAGDAAWMAMVAEAAASASKLTGYTSEQVLVAAASELAGQ
ncbi:hypothetical protein OEZ85_005872 [Tetradesmus obliquus]|uniref:Uncharacterized protein n=1 Tax=Tetradesmus obliquus TaxID=3088 RepID=A0ABY8UFQ6_TETOB|nr:hypothetical protein OEZ85_005872 [Tetradesmus obliquus]